MIQRNDLIPQIEELYKKYNASLDPEFNQFGILDERDQDKDVLNDWRGNYNPTAKTVFIWKATCNPGVNATKKKEGGAAHLCKGFHGDMWVIDMHAADNPTFRHIAFCQRPQYGCKPIKIWRDKDRDYVNDDNIYEWTNSAGINGHRASVQRDIVEIDDYSWACQVSQNHLDHEKEIEWAKATGKYRANSKCLFSYLLFGIEEIQL